ncbi:MAG: SrfA family protein [Proteobacteria bacterium]|nr:SrfA family protein [Pseudomonadota bacterium]
MSGDSPTLIVTTRNGVRPLGVRGASLHEAAPQLARVLRRRLGDAAADLLAEPQVHADGKTIDWIAGWSGTVRTLDSLPAAARAPVMANVEATLAEIRRLGDVLAGHGPKEETGVVGLSLKLAARAPSPAYIFLVGDRPVIVAWGYEKDSAPTLPPLPAPVSPPAVAPPVVPPAASTSPSLAGATPPPVPDGRPARRSVLQPGAGAADDDRTVEVPRRGAANVPPAGAAAAAAGVPWLRTLAAALPLMLLLIGGAWLLRGCLPAEPALDIATREAAEAPTPQQVAEDRLPVLKASLSAEQSRQRALKVELSLAEAEIKRRLAECKPPEAAKPPPQVAIAPPPPAPAPQPKATPPAPPPQPKVAPRNPNDNRLRLPPAPTNNYSFMEGCWRTDPFRHEAQQMQPGVSSYCFDASGNGRLEWRRGRTACRTNAQARFSGAVLALRDSDSTCNDGSRWFADQLNCQRGADNVAQCSGRSRDAYGRLVSWTVNLHKLN